MIRRRGRIRRAAERELAEAKRLTSESVLQAHREYRASVDRLVASQQVTLALSVHNAFLEQSATDSNRASSIRR